jgi:hypothetical protein
VAETTESEWTGAEALEFLWGCSKQIVDHVEKIEFEEARRFIGERCFRRIMLMTLTFLRLNPLTSFFSPNGHWDLPSSAAIARCIMETYLRMFYFGVEQVGEAEGHFRAILVPNVENTVQFAAQRAGQSYLDTYEARPDAIGAGPAAAHLGAGGRWFESGLRPVPGAPTVSVVPRRLLKLTVARLLPTESEAPDLDKLTRSHFERRMRLRNLKLIVLEKKTRPVAVWPGSWGRAKRAAPVTARGGLDTMIT